jgi:hypothetical protein
LDRIATGEDRVQTGLDRVQTGLDRIAAANSAASAAQVGTSTPLTGFTVGGNTAIVGTDTILQGFGMALGGSVGFGQVAFGTGTKLLGGDSGLVWDNVNKRLGIGVSSPVYKLDLRNIESSILFAQTVATSGSIIRVRSNNGSTEIIDISASGNVGIGTISSSNKLQVVGNVLISGINSTRTLSIDGGVSGGTFNMGQPVTGVGIFRLRSDFDNLVIQGGFNDGNRRTISFNTGDTERIFINTNGRIGISTNLPGALLDVNGTGRIRNGVSLADVSGNVQVGPTFADAGFRLDVNGTARVQGAFTVTSNIILPTTTGTRIGTATNQLLSFWNKTPILQPTTGISAATLAGSGGSTLTSGNTFGGYTIQQISQALINIGILA